MCRFTVSDALTLTRILMNTGAQYSAIVLASAKYNEKIIINSSSIPARQRNYKVDSFSTICEIEKMMDISEDATVLLFLVGMLRAVFMLCYILYQEPKKN